MSEYEEFYDDEYPVRMFSSLPVFADQLEDPRLSQDPYYNEPDCELVTCTVCEEEHINVPVNAALRWYALRDACWSDDPLACPDCAWQLSLND